MNIFNKKYIKSETIKIEGMKCENCKARVIDALKAINVSSKINLKEGIATVSYDTRNTSMQDIKRAIDVIGFSCIDYE